MINRKTLHKAKLHIRTHVATKEEIQIVKAHKQQCLLKLKSQNICHNKENNKLNSDEVEKLVRDAITKLNLWNTTEKEFEMWQKIIQAIKQKENHSRSSIKE